MIRFCVTALCLICSVAHAMDEAELRALIAQTEQSAYGAVGPVVELPVGDIVLKEPLVISDRAHFVMRGRGDLATRFLYQGPQDEAAIILEHCTKSRIEGFSLVGNGAFAGVSIRTRRDSPRWPISSSNVVRHVGAQNFQNGFFIDSRKRDKNNEFHRFEFCKAFNCTRAGFRIWGSQAHRISFDWCNAHNCGIGLWSQYGTYWSWNNGQGTNNGTDFVPDSFWVSVSVADHRSEGSQSLLRTSAEWSRMPISLRRITWDGGPLYGQDVINIQGNGPITIEDVDLSSGNGNPIYVRGFDHDAGNVRVSGLTFTYRNPPEMDTPQKPIQFPEHFQQQITGIHERIITPDKWYERALPHNPPFVSVPIDDPQFQSGRIVRPEWPLPPSYKRLRSFALNCDVTFDEIGPGGIVHTEVLSVGGVGVWLLNDTQLRLEGVGHAEVDLTAGTTYPLEVHYNRDTGDMSLRFGETEISGNADLPADRAELILGSRNGQNGRLRGRIENIEMRDAA